jgi:hypothetical protein
MEWNFNRSEPSLDDIVQG